MLASSAGNDKLAIVPRAALRSYFGAFSLLSTPGCPMLQPSARTREALPASAHCWMREHALRDCLFRVKPALDGIETGKYYKSGEHVWAPNIASQCSADMVDMAGGRRRRALQAGAEGAEGAEGADGAEEGAEGAEEGAEGAEEDAEALPLAERVAMLEQSLASLVASAASPPPPPPPTPSPTALPAKRESIASMLSDAITYDDYRQPVECV